MERWKPLRVFPPLFADASILEVVRDRFDGCVEIGDKDGAEALYEQVDMLKRYMNKAHEKKVWRTLVTEGGE